MSFTTSFVCDPYKEYGYPSEVEEVAAEAPEAAVSELVGQIGRSTCAAVGQAAKKAAIRGRDNICHFAVGATLVAPFSAARLGTLYAQGKVTENQYQKLLAAMSPEQSRLRLKMHLTEAWVSPNANGTLSEVSIVQGSLLSELPRFLLKHTYPAEVARVDSQLAKAFRVATTAVRFASFPSVSERGKAEAVALGLICGTLKESRFGAMGAYGALVAHYAVMKWPTIRISQ